MTRARTTKGWLIGLVAPVIAGAILSAPVSTNAQTQEAPPLIPAPVEPERSSAPPASAPTEAPVADQSEAVEGPALAGPSAETSAAATAVDEGALLPPTLTTIDGNGVDLIGGHVHDTQPMVSIGAGSAQLGHSRLLVGKEFRDSFTATIVYNQDEDGGNASWTVSFGGASEKFFLGNGKAFPDHGSTLTFTGSDALYTTRNGTRVEFFSYWGGKWPVRSDLLARRIVYPSGEAIEFHYKTVRKDDSCSTSPYDPTCQGLALLSATSSYGYQIRWTETGEGGQAVGLNLTLNNCDPATVTCPAFVQPVYDALRLNRAKTYSIAFPGVTITRPSGGAPEVYEYDYATDRVKSYSNEAGRWNYTHRVFVDHEEASVVDQDGHRRTITYKPAGAHYEPGVRLLTDGHDLDGDGDVEGDERSYYAYSADGRLQEVKNPEGDRAVYAYDSRGNVTSKTHHPKPGSALAPIVVSATYRPDCPNPKTCNKPLTITDARAGVTSFEYSEVHGGVTKITRPAVGGGSPVVQFDYAELRPAYYRGGTIQPSAAPIYALARTRTCATLASCDGTADQSVAGVEFESPAAANNGRPLKTYSAAGDGSLRVEQTAIYDAAGNVIYLDGPFAGAVDRSRLIYDSSRRKTGEVGPDPDGAGPMLRRATRTTYNRSDQVTSVEVGTSATQASADWLGMSVLQRLNYSHNRQGFKVAESLVMGGVTRSLTEYGHNADGTVACVAVRMNTSAFGAERYGCTASPALTGVEPDRITLTNYDARHNPKEVISAIGTGVQRLDAGRTYRPNGKVATATDGNGNTTSYAYDGFDRLAGVFYPDPGTGQPSGSDTEQFFYDPASNVTYERRRSGAQFYRYYDALNRMTFEDRPPGEGDLGTSYDLQSRPVYVGRDGEPDSGLVFGYDALGRKTLERSARGDVLSYYDVAGRRTTLVHPDGFPVSYDRNVLGEITKVRHWNATTGHGVLARYEYDNLGRRTKLTRGNGTSTTWTYDGPELGVLRHFLTPSQPAFEDQKSTFAYNAAGQLTRRESANAAFNWRQPLAQNRSYAHNRRNQMVTNAGVGLSYHPSGALLNDGTLSYAYDADNRLTAVGDNFGGTAVFAFDPLGRLRRVAAPVGRQFGYDGSELIAEHADGGAVLRRYVHGPGEDEPLAWYEGNGADDVRWLVADELGSTVALTDRAGARSINTYDEYGVPGQANVGLFQYTGQMWLREAGLYHYKARSYSPTLGRFLQHDPIGYGDGMNLYAYVGGDPVNGRDPSGLYNNAEPATDVSEIVVTGRRRAKPIPNIPGFDGWSYWNDQKNDIENACSFLGWDSGGCLVNDPQVQCDFYQNCGLANELQIAQNIFNPDKKEEDSCTLVSDRPAGASFTDACAQHDSCYETIGSNRNVCDYRFKDRMDRACDQAYASADCRDAAGFYYQGVKTFGLPFYLWEQGESRVQRALD